MVRIDVLYQGQLRCEATHEPSRATLLTDAPKDNHGKGAAFSPTDLVATALGTCILTIMGIVAERQQWDLTGATVTVIKEMASQPQRRIGRLAVTVRFKEHQDEARLKVLEEAAHGCPVHKSLHPEIDIPVHFENPTPSA